MVHVNQSVGWNHFGPAGYWQQHGLYGLEALVVFRFCRCPLNYVAINVCICFFWQSTLWSGVALLSLCGCVHVVWMHPCVSAVQLLNNIIKIKLWCCFCWNILFQWQEITFLEPALYDSQGKHSLFLSASVFSPAIFEYIVSQYHVCCLHVLNIKYLEITF